MQEIIKYVEDKFDAAKDHFENEIRSIRTGRANAVLVEDIRVDSYGQSMRIKDIASITIPDAMSILMHPWDKANVKPIEDALRSCDLGVGVVNTGDSIRATLPELSAQRREELKKVLAKKAEEARISMRNARREAIEKIKKQEKDKEVGEDEAKRGEKQVQVALDKAIAEIDEIIEKKQREIVL